MSTSVKNGLHNRNTNIFTARMKQKTLFLAIGFLIVVVSGSAFLTVEKGERKDAQQIKVVLRNVGHQLLLSYGDSLSLVLPVVKKGNTSYLISFEQALSITPEKLVNIVERNFQQTSLNTYYLVEIIQCNSGEVAYSYQVNNSQETNITPCKGRVLPENCYYIKVSFTPNTVHQKQSILPFFGLFGGFLFLIMGIYLQKKKPELIDNTQTYISLGGYQFYPEQNKLIKEAKTIPLSKKECEILSIFIEHPNQVIKREELTKRVWEDNGVIVGRSLDTYISKLRKKLQEDQTVKITNVHGVGYKLEITG